MDVVTLMILSRSRRIATLVEILKRRRLLRLKIVRIMILITVRLMLRVHDVWLLPKCDKWWTDIVLPMPESEWKKNFRVSKKTYHFLCEKMVFIARSDTKFRKCISLPKRIAVAIYTLSSSAEYRTIAHVFGIGKTSVCNIISEFCGVFTDLFLEEFINLPQTEAQVKEAAEGFFLSWGFPQCIGAIDGAHIKVKPPKDEAHCYFNYKQFYSIVLFACVDYAYRFRYINVGCTGRNNDAHVFKLSSLYSYLTNNDMLFELTETYSGVAVPVCVVGDSAFPLLPTLQKPYMEQASMPDIYRIYNYRLSRGRRVVENAFGRLKARFRILKSMENNIKNCSAIIETTCILNNICELFGDLIDTSWMNETTNSPAFQSQSVAGENGETAKEIRDALAAYFFEHPLP